MLDTITPPDQFGPIYPDLGTKVAKLRHHARRDPEWRRAHGEAVIEAVRRLQATEMKRGTSIPQPNCASRTAHNTAEAILKAINEQNRRRVLAPGPPRPDDLIRELYTAAMAAKRVT